MTIDTPGNSAGYTEVMTSVSRLFEDRVKIDPDSIAISDATGTMTYADLGTTVDQLAELLVQRGAGAESVVAVGLPRGRQLITALLAVLKSGAAYLPLPPDLPTERRGYMVKASGAILEVSADTENGFTVVDMDTCHHGAPPATGRSWPTPHPDNLAYLIFTSGSTGRPKPVGVTHRSLTHHACVVADVLGLTADDRVLQFANSAFDVFGEEVFPTLVAGGTVVVPPDTVFLGPIELEAHIRREQVTIANLPTPYWEQWVLDVDTRPRALPETLRLLVVGSDMGHTRTLRSWWRHTDVPVHNAYGLTETTITAVMHALTAGELSDNGLLPIGHPLPRTEVRLLDDDLAPVPDGSTGEIYVGGTHLARGYPGLPTLTAARFVPDPAGGRTAARLYRTGDLARRLPGGCLMFLGRSDEQVKIRGQRVELGEIRAALLDHPAVHRAHVRNVADGEGDNRLIAYVVTDDVPESDLRAHLVKHLPATMLPTAYVRLGELPLTPSGKIDHRALPTPARANSPVDNDPLTDSQQQIAAVWREVLRTDRVGIDDSFFEIGGHSMLLVQVQRLLEQRTGRSVSTVALFRYPTVRALATHLSGGHEESTRDRADKRRAARTRLSEHRARRSRIEEAR